jgi:hypothetical protein
VSVHVLKLSRNAYILLTALTGIGVGFLEVVVPHYVQDTIVAQALMQLIPQVGTAIAAYFTAEQSQR